MNDASLCMTPIGHVRGGRREATKDGWGGNRFKPVWTGYLPREAVREPA